MALGPEQVDIDQDQGIIFLAINSYSKDPHHRLLWADTALRGYAETFHNHLYFRVVPLPDVESFEEVFEKLPEFARQVEASHYQFVSLAFVGHGKQVDGFDCLLTNSNLRPTRISDIIAEFEKAFMHKIKLFFFDMCRESNHPNPSRILLGPHQQLPQNSYIVFSTQCNSKAWDYAYQPGSHKYSVWSQHFNELISAVVNVSLSQVIVSVNMRLKSINQRAEVIDTGDIGGRCVLFSERDSREFTEEDKVALREYKSFMNVVRLGHGSTSIVVHDLLQPFYNNVLEIVREILEDQRRSDGLARVQQFLQRCLNGSADVIVEDIHTIFKQYSAGFFCYDLNIFKCFVEEFPYSKLQVAVSALERVQSEIRNDPHAPYHFAEVKFQVAFHTFRVQSIPVAFVLNGSSFTHNCQSGVELVEFLKGIFPGVYFAGIKEGCLMAIFVFDLLLALQLPVLLLSHLPRLTDLTVTEVYISDLVRISVCNGKVAFLGSKEELKELCEVYEETLVVEKDLIRTDTLRSARNIMSKLYVETFEQSLPYSEIPDGLLASLKMFYTRLKEYLTSWRFLSRSKVTHCSPEPDMVNPNVLDESLDNCLVGLSSEQMGDQASQDNPVNVQQENVHGGPLVARAHPFPSGPAEVHDPSTTIQEPIQVSQDPLNQNPEQSGQHVMVASPLQGHDHPVLDSTPGESEINQKVGSRMSAQWDQFAIQLSFDLNTRRKIRKNNLGNCDDCFANVVSLWLERSAGRRDSPRTWRTVLEAVRKCGHWGVADDVHEALLAVHSED